LESDVLVAAKLPGGDEGDYDVRHATASKKLVVVAWIACRCTAQAQTELAEAVGFARAIQAA
jgi:hypothetical protein